MNKHKRNKEKRRCLKIVVKHLEDRTTRRNKIGNVPFTAAGSVIGATSFRLFFLKTLRPVTWSIDRFIIELLCILAPAAYAYRPISYSKPSNELKQKIYSQGGFYKSNRVYKKRVIGFRARKLDELFEHNEETASVIFTYRCIKCGHTTFVNMHHLGSTESGICPQCSSRWQITRRTKLSKRDYKILSDKTNPAIHERRLNPEDRSINPSCWMSLGFKVYYVVKVQVKTSRTKFKERTFRCTTPWL